jgi:L-seryl-tRNA(Ser) seleniumtransferase
MRAVRPDKTTIAALVATLESYRDGTAETELPVWRMISAKVDDLARRAEAVRAGLGRLGVEASVVETRSTVGGGSLPEETQPSRGVALEGRPTSVAERLRRAETPVIGHVVEEKAVLDMRTVRPEDDALLVQVVAAALTKGE